MGRDTLSPYKIEVHARQDGFRAMRLVRSRAAEFGIDVNRIGMMGFSAGGEVVNMVAFDPGNGNPNAPDAIDRASSKTKFYYTNIPRPAFYTCYRNCRCTTLHF